ncbi:hypothetical protein [Rhizobium sp. MHM7A]|uniref:hypothetical protein n=1 Tax=Rhizobium sp. MHM7A TaxID=2583233 RepID=UPI0011072809|nr:hypothetical protein [Rhizobium sp. MHM7A]TLX16791.1 hypothetical protein FFR93_05455 [Rhizobium sp. MHM7A]
MPETYRYTHANLENVHLLNGFFIENDPDLGESAGIEAINEMNDRLRKIMIVQAPYLDGVQLYWLRSEMGINRETLARLMAVPVRTIASYEERRMPLPQEFDDAFRSLFCEKMGLKVYDKTWASQEYGHPYSIRLAIEGGCWVGHIAY